jgi:hypothetical protein
LQGNIESKDVTAAKPSIMAGVFDNKSDELGPGLFKILASGIGLLRGSLHSLF